MRARGSEGRREGDAGGKVPSTTIHAPAATSASSWPAAQVVAPRKNLKRACGTKTLHQAGLRCAAPLSRDRAARRRQARVCHARASSLPAAEPQPIAERGGACEARRRRVADRVPEKARGPRRRRCPRALPPSGGRRGRSAAACRPARGVRSRRSRRSRCRCRPSAPPAGRRGAGALLSARPCGPRRGAGARPRVEERETDRQRRTELCATVPRTVLPHEDSAT